MGHRRSHTHARASKRGSPEEATHPGVKYDTNEEHSKSPHKNRRPKQERKRKREQEYKESSRRKHREKYEGNHKCKEKPKAKVIRRKDDRSPTNYTSESENSTSSRGAYYHRRTHKAYPLQEHGDISNVDLATSKHRSKRSRETNTARSSKDDVRETYEASKDAMHVENYGVRGTTNEPLVQVKDASEEAEVKRRHTPMRQDRHNATILRTQDHDTRLDGRKDKVLEVDLRQRALANFLRHQDPPCKMDERMERISPPAHEGTTLSGFKNEQAGPEVDSRTALSNALKVDNHTPIDACASNISAHVSHRDHREGIQLACNSSSNLEEGEIASDNENAAGSEHVYHMTHEAKALYDKDNTQTEAQQANAGKIERLDTELVNDVATSLKEKQEVSQEHAVDGGLHVASPAAAQDDVDDSFQQKTMSVMRGGEMVQVSYKVYIPQRAVELARRRLQR